MVLVKLFRNCLKIEKRASRIKKVICCTASFIFFFSAHINFISTQSTTSWSNSLAKLMKMSSEHSISFNNKHHKNSTLRTERKIKEQNWNYSQWQLQFAGLVVAIHKAECAISYVKIFNLWWFKAHSVKVTEIF